MTTQPPLCDFCQERLAAALQHRHVTPKWAKRAARDLARQCCSPRDRDLR